MTSNTRNTVQQAQTKPFYPVGQFKGTLEIFDTGVVQLNQKDGTTPVKVYRTAAAAIGAIQEQVSNNCSLAGTTVEARARTNKDGDIYLSVHRFSGPEADEKLGEAMLAMRGSLDKDVHEYVGFHEDEDRKNRLFEDARFSELFEQWRSAVQAAAPYAGADSTKGSPIQVKKAYDRAEAAWRQLSDERRPAAERVRLADQAAEFARQAEEAAKRIAETSSGSSFRSYNSPGVHFEERELSGPGFQR